MKPRYAAVPAVCMLLVAGMLAAGCICSGGEKPGPTPAPTAVPTPVPSANLTGWGTDRDSYARNTTATGWVNVTNTGSTPIDEISFATVISRTVLFFPVEKTFYYNATGLSIKPGETRRVQFSQVIPAEYSGISTEGDYRLTVTAGIAGRPAGSFSKDIKVT